MIVQPTSDGMNVSARSAAAVHHACLRRLLRRHARPCAVDRLVTRNWMSTTVKRDYSLIGRDSGFAQEHGLVAAEWYHTDVPRQRMKALMRRRDGPAIRDTAIWFLLLALTGFGGLLVLGQLEVRAVLPLLRRPLWIGVGLALARGRPRDGIPDLVVQRRALPAGVVHEHEGAHPLAVEPCPSPHRHDHRRSRP